ncbi:MAG TPA: flagellar biosynthetic protein FliR [Rhodospirillaceae bacterium]|nr:flagellar biosynthetic protein FliR [Candidatus Neomarinimicrobiota bacterium]HCX13861.1 flagellar biosynthetic protein FliR [Rhodospirillaceae bacterium]
MQLNDYLAINVFHLFLIFARMSVVFMLMPGVSAGYIPVRIRLILALMITILILPIVQDTLPLQPDTPAELVKLIVIEVIIGGFIGGLIQILMAALDMAGHMMSMAVGLMNAFVQDPVAEQQSAIIIGFLNLVAIALIFIIGLHHVMIMAIVDSYSLFQVGAPLFSEDMLSMIVSLMVQTFHMAIRLAAPLVVFEMIFQVTSGILSRLSPQLNVFFVVLPGKIMLGVAILMIVIPTLMLTFMTYMDNSLHTLLTPR